MALTRRSSRILVRLVARRWGNERIELHAIFVDPGDRRVGRKAELVPLGIDDLRDEGDVGEAGHVAMAEAAGPGIRREEPFERLKARIDPVIVPDCDVAFVTTKGVREIAQNPQIVDRVDVAGDNLDSPAYPRSVRRV